jgi:hypothetical protein
MSEKQRSGKIFLWLWVIQTLLLLIFLVVREAGAVTPPQVQICGDATVKAGTPPPAYSACSAHIVCGPNTATDLTRTQDANGNQIYLPFSQLTLTSAVVNCASGQWSTLKVVGATAPPITPPPVIPPPVTPPPTPTTSTYSVGWIDPTLGPIGYVVTNLPNSVQQCFTISSGTHSVQACLPANP